MVMNMKDRQPELGYWKIRGFAQPIKFLLAYLNVQYTEQVYEVGAPHYSSACWPQVKDSLELDFEDMPYYVDAEDPNLKLTNTLAIIKYIAMKYGSESLVGQTAEQKGQVEMLAHVITDLLNNKATKLCYDPSQDKHKLGSILVEDMSSIAQFMETSQAEGFFLVGEKPSYADFILFELINRVDWMSEGDLLKTYPNLKYFHTMFRELPGIQEYLQTN